MEGAGRTGQRGGECVLLGGATRAVQDLRRDGGSRQRAEGLTNTFFLTLNTAAVTAIGVVWSGKEHGLRWILPFLFVGLVIECLAWFWLLRSYRQLNTAKYLVVGALEERLPASPYWAAEWSALGKGEDPARYWPLSHLEQWLPALFIGLYLFGFIAALVTQ